MAKPEKPAGLGPNRTPSGNRVISATEAQNNFGRVLGQAASEGAVFITKYGEPAAVVLSIDAYNSLVASDAADLDELTREFDAMLARMRTEEAAAGVEALFEMDSAALGKAAARGAREAGE